MAFATLSMEQFTSSDADPGGTLCRFNTYVDRMRLLFDLVFRKADGSAYTPSDKEKKAMLLFRGGEDMQNLFDHVGMVVEADTFDQAINKITNALKGRTNNVVQRNLLLTRHPQGTKSFEKWSMEISNAAKLIDYTNFDWKMAAVDAMVLQTSNPRLREKALNDNANYENFMKIGVAKEQSEKGAAQLLGSSNQGTLSVKEEDVRKLQDDVKKLRFKVNNETAGKIRCQRCGYDRCPGPKKCPANGKTCSKCGGTNHFAQACRSRNTKNSVKYLSDSEDEDLKRIMEVKKLSNEGIAAKLKIKPHNAYNEAEVHLATDTGVRKTLINKTDWLKIKKDAELVKTSKLFRPYGTQYHLPIIGRSYVTLTAERGASIDTWVYVVNSQKDTSLLGESDAVRLGIVDIDLQGAETEVVIRNVEYIPKTSTPDDQAVSAGQTQSEIDRDMDKIKEKFSNVFSDRTGKFRGAQIRIQVEKDATPVIQPRRKIPLHYVDKLEVEIKKMLEEDIIEGPLDEEENGTFISNLVIADRKDSDRIRVTLDCKNVNKFINATHEPIPTSEELRHKLKGCDRFSKVDMTNCFHQFEIEESARKLFAFRTPVGIFRFKRMVMGTSPASSEIQRKIRETIQTCNNAVHIKDDIIVYGVGKQHDTDLEQVLSTLQDKGLTLRPEKCELGKPEITWFGNVYSKHGMSPDPEKCRIIKQWPAPKSKEEVKSFLQTVQFNAKFLNGRPGEASYPELTEPLRKLTRKYIRFSWGEKQECSFQELKKRLCSDRVLVPFDTSLRTRVYVDSSFAGTQATVAQEHVNDGKECWRPVNHTSRPWTSTESDYSQIERESNGILTAMHMNRMYTLGTHIEVVTDHAPLLPIYASDTNKQRPLRVTITVQNFFPGSYTT